MTGLHRKEQPAETAFYSVASVGGWIGQALRDGVKVSHD